MTADRQTAFRALHDADWPLVLPNAWDYASAAALFAAGFPAVGTTSLGVAAAHGLPDAQGRARAETLALMRRLGALPGLVTVDVEAGFSEEPDEVAQTAAELSAAGAVGINIEDGRSDGTLTPVPQQVALIQAVKARAPELFVNARTDTHWLTGPEPPGLDETLARADAYLAAGADGIFVPGIVAESDIQALVTRTGAPVNVLYLPRVHTVPRLADLGVRRISTGSLLFRAALHAAVRTARAVAEGHPVPGDLPSYADVQRLVSPGWTP
jgi:2-methylisocitrate lyase-like PEP mutase family enzyme